MRAYFKKLYRYNQWANQALCDHLKALNRELPEISKRMCHIVAAEEIWYHRLAPLGFDPLPRFGNMEWEVLEPRLASSARHWLDLVEKTEDFEAVFSYSNLAGRSYSTPLEDILIHLANHGTYHRGQVATLLRERGAGSVERRVLSRERGVRKSLRSYQSRGIHERARIL